MQAKYSFHILLSVVNVKICSDNSRTNFPIFSGLCGGMSSQLCTLFFLILKLNIFLKLLTIQAFICNSSFAAGDYCDPCNIFVTGQWKQI